MITESNTENQAIAQDELRLPELLVFSDDWGRHPSSCQHLTRALMNKFDVTWVNTIGMRPPRLNVDTLKRGWEKIGHWRGATKTEVESSVVEPTVLNPKMWPWNASRFDRAINRRLLVRQVNTHLDAGRKRIGITTLPLVADLMDGLNVDAWIYYCVDDFTVWPGIDHRPLQAMETALVQNADRIITVSETLQRRVRNLGGESTLMTHGVDVAHWQNLEDHSVRDDVIELDSPLIVFWGLIDKRMDESFVEQLSKELTFGTIALVGPTDSPPAKLFELPRVKHLEAMSLNELAALGQRADVLIMPYVDADVTRAMQPLKMLEYLATGKPVVARRLPASQPWSDCLDLVDTARGFSTLVLDVLESGLGDEKADARKRLIAESWTSKASELESMILELAKS